MLGSGASSASQGGSPLQWRGMAPKARVWSYIWWNNVNELNTRYNNAINAQKAVLSQNSWGIGPATISIANCEAVLGNYFIENAALDDVAKGSLGKPIPIVWAAGNDISTGGSYCGS